MAGYEVSKTMPQRSVVWKGKNYKPGEIIPDLSSSEAKRLLAKGTVVVQKETKKAAEKTTQKTAA